MRNGLRRRDGFTLIEILVAITIMSVVTTIGLRMFVLITGQWREQRSMTYLNTQANNAFREIERDLTDALSAEISGVAIRGYDETKSGQGFNAAPDQSDRIVIPVQGAAKQSSLANAWSVQYRLAEDSEGKNVLYRSVGKLGTENPSNGRQTYMPDANVVRFDITYATGGDENPWVSSWNSDMNPKAVRVSMTISDPEYPFRQISRKEVYTVHTR